MNSYTNSLEMKKRKKTQEYGNAERKREMKGKFASFKGQKN